MKTLEPKKMWLKFVGASLLSLLTMVACNKNDTQTTASAPVTNPVVTTCAAGTVCTNYASSANLIASALARIVSYSGNYEMAIQILAQSALNQTNFQNTSAISSIGYYGPVTIQGTLTVFQGSSSYGTCTPQAGSYSIRGSGNFSSASFVLQSNLVAQAGSGQITLTTSNTFLQDAVPAAVSSTNNQSFPFRLLGDVFVSGSGYQSSWGSNLPCAIQQSLFFGLN